MNTTQHTLAMEHYSNCTMEAWHEIKEAMEVMQPLYRAAPDLLAVLEAYNNDLLEQVNGEPTPERCMEINETIRMVIAKAKGE